MISKSKSSRRGQKFWLSLEVFVSWFGFSLLFVPTDGTFAAIYGAALSTLLSLMVLDGIGYFRFDPRPKKSDLFTLLITLPIPVLLSQWLLRFLLNAPLIRYREAIAVSTLVAGSTYLFQIVESQIALLLTGRWKVLTYLLPGELEELKNELESSASSKWFEVVPSVSIYQNRSVSPAMMKKVLKDNEIWVISRGAVRDLRNFPDLIRAQLEGIPVVDAREFLQEFRGRISLSNADAWTFLRGSTYKTFLVRLYFDAKAFVEPVVSVCLLLLLSPVLIAISIAVKSSSPGPVIFKQLRSGYRDKKFWLLKFRSMRTDAEQTGPQWAGKDDDRTTPVGKWLRITRLDELPQLVNVILGQISFVGPRPERPEFYEKLNEQIPQFSLRLLVRPGITGWAQVHSGYAASVEESKTKLEFDLYYIQKMSPALDFKIVIKTLGLLMGGSSGR